MSGENLYLFRQQLSPDGPPVPPRVFWFVMGVGVGLATGGAYTFDGAWWQIALFAIGVGGIFGLIFNVAI